MANGHIVTTAATGEEISIIVDRLEEALDGENRGHAIIATLSMTLALMDPDISGEDLTRGVNDVSQFICMWLDSRSPEVMN